MFGIYIHIPFCLKKCGYCDFYSVPVEAKAVPHEKYLAAVKGQLERDVQEFGLAGRKVSTIYFGGGTPSLMPPEFFASVFDALSRRFTIDDNAEISSEVNPATASKEWFDAVRREGVTRISIGAQSFSDKLLKTLGRIHTAEDAMVAVACAQEAGFKSVSVDLMYAIPGETAADLEDDLRTAMTFQPEHVSAYQLTLLKSPSPLVGEGRGEGETNCNFHPPLNPLPSREGKVSEDMQLKQMRIVVRMLERGGWKRYEISNFAKPGFECAHNLNYWRYGEYLGLGAGATSFVRNHPSPPVGEGETNCNFHPPLDPLPSREGKMFFAKRWTEPCDIEKYIRADTVPPEAEEINMKTAMGEFCFMGLRTVEGVSAKEFERIFGSPFEKIYGETMVELVQAKFVCYENGRLKLTQKGFELSNQISERFI